MHKCFELLADTKSKNDTSPILLYLDGYVTFPYETEVYSDSVTVNDIVFTSIEDVSLNTSFCRSVTTI
jgi:hypothetical protein